MTTSPAPAASPCHATPPEYLCDVAICGGGVAGLTFARQLRRQYPQLSVLVVDRLVRPLPEAAFKVGETTTETGAWYLGKALGLADYLDSRHLRKLGLRMFFQGETADTPLDRRIEIGVSEFLEPYSYAVDRGRMEQDLRGMLVDQGVELWEGADITEFQLGRGGGPHRLSVQAADGSRRVAARWLVDASGRRGLLRRRLGLTVANPGHSSVWFRVRGEVDVADWVPADNAAWHARVAPGARRYHSAVHLVGPGYWVWLIALPGGHTSIGIVTDGVRHPYTTYNIPDKCTAWIDRHEPLLGDAIRGMGMLDFRKMPNYSFHTRQAFSADRWACIGEAAAFPDPFYGTGFELIAMNNSMALQLIGQDFQGSLTSARVEGANAFFASFCQGLTDSIQGTYPYLGHPLAATMKILWDTLAGWAFNAPLVTHGLYLDGARGNRARGQTARFHFLARRVKRILTEWSGQPPGEVVLGSLDFVRLPFFRAARRRGFREGLDEAALAAHHEESLALFERMALAIFLLALADTRPEALRRLPADAPLNPWAVGLDSAKWEDDGLFRPATATTGPGEVLAALLTMIGAPSLARFASQAPAAAPGGSGRGGADQKGVAAAGRPAAGE